MERGTHDEREVRAEAHDDGLPREHDEWPCERQAKVVRERSLAPGELERGEVGRRAGAAADGCETLDVRARSFKKEREKGKDTPAALKARSVGGYVSGRRANETTRRTAALSRVKGIRVYSHADR